MSDPVSNAKVEDVLASIRRLVSQDERPPGGSVADAGSAAARDRLILTPSLRVAGDTADTAGGDNPAPDPASVADGADAGGSGHSEVTEPGDAGAVPVPDKTAVFCLDESVRLHGRNGTPEEGGTAPDHTAAEQHSPEETPTETPDDTDPPATGATNPAEPAEPPGGGLAAAVPYTDRIPDEKIAALEAGSAPSDDVGSAPAGDRPHVPLLLVPEDRDDVPDAADLVAGRSSGLADTIRDEEALRGMIAEVVRQELQGVLGDRITRNVRKLVRREILRALAAKDLDMDLD